MIKYTIIQCIKQSKFFIFDATFIEISCEMKTLSLKNAEFVDIYMIHLFQRKKNQYCIHYYYNAALK